MTAEQVALLIRYAVEQGRCLYVAAGFIVAAIIGSAGLVWAAIASAPERDEAAGVITAKSDIRP